MQYKEIVSNLFKRTLGISNLAMKLFTKTIYGIKVTAYNDSNVEWVVKAGDMTEQRFDKNKFNMREAMEFKARLLSGDTPSAQK